MAEGVALVGGFLQLIDFTFKTFNGCLEAYKFIYTAQHLGRDGDSLRSRLLFEDIRLKRWATRAGLPDHPQRRLDWQTIASILQEQEKFITSADALRRKYELDVPEVVVAVDEVPSFYTRDAQDTPAPGSTGILLRLRTKTFSNPANARPMMNRTIKRIQWAAVGKERTIKIIQEVGALNSRLYELLELAAQDEARESMHALLRDALSRCTNTSEISNIQGLLHPDDSTDAAAIDAAARTRSLRLLMSGDRREEQAIKAYADQVKVKTFNEKKLVLGSDEYRGMVLGRYGDDSILIEWRIVREASWDQLQRPMHELAALLSTAHNAAFHNLKCAGLFELPDRNRFGLVFEIPSPKSGNDVSKNVDDILSMEAGSLHDLLGSLPRASLADRIRIGRDMSEAVMQLHTAGWLHKGIRSLNVFFLAARGGRSADLLASEPYLVGYEDSRPTLNGTDLTELPLIVPYADLYRHPDARGKSRQQFQKRFDMYALACILIELALWKPLQQIFAIHTRRDLDKEMKEAEHNRVNMQVPSLDDIVHSTSFVEEILHSVGPGYLEAVNLCLSMRQISSEEDEASLQVQRAVLRQLRLYKP